MTDEKRILIDDVHDMLGGCRANHRALEALLEATNDAEFAQMLRKGIEGSEKGLDTMRGFLADHGVEEDDNRRNALSDIADEVHAVAHASDGNGAGATERQLMGLYLRLVHYARAGYAYYVPTLGRLGLDTHRDRFAADFERIEQGIAPVEARLAA